MTALADYPTMKANKSVASLIFTLADGTQYVVSGNSTSSEKTINIENPFIHTSAQALTAARLILSCYGGNLIETTGRGDPSGEIGDVDTIWLDESQATTARRMMQTFKIQDGALQGCQSRLLQADGSFLFQARPDRGQLCFWTIQQRKWQPFPVWLYGHCKRRQFCADWSPKACPWLWRWWCKGPGWDQGQPP